MSWSDRTGKSWIRSPWRELRGWVATIRRSSGFKWFHLNVRLVSQNGIFDGCSGGFDGDRDTSAIAATPGRLVRPGPRRDDPVRSSMNIAAPPSVPTIAKLPEATGPRPEWSVMIPTYNASDFLEPALRGVLAQDPGPDRMQIALVDDHSPGWEFARDLAETLAPGRIEFHRNETNVGLAGNWNRCLDLSRGHRVHILHQDDVILTGFYEALGRGFDAPEAPAAVFCQHVTIDEAGLWEKLSNLERRTPGPLGPDWAVQLSLFPRIQCPSIAVKRSVYEELGGFNPGLKYALDWEMWLRIASRHPMWFEPAVLACYRLHSNNETARLRANDEDLADVRQAVEIMRRYVPESARSQVGRGMRAIHRDRLLHEVSDLLSRGEIGPGLNRLHRAIQVAPGLRFSRVRWKYYHWAAKLWLRGLGKETTRS